MAHPCTHAQKPPFLHPSTVMRPPLDCPSQEAVAVNAIPQHRPMMAMRSQGSWRLPTPPAGAHQRHPSALARNNPFTGSLQLFCKVLQQLLRRKLPLPLMLKKKKGCAHINHHSSSLLTVVQGTGTRTNVQALNPKPTIKLE